MELFANHAYVPKHINTRNGSAFTSQVKEDLLNKTGIELSHAIVNHAQTIGLLERSHQKLKQIL